MSRLRIHLVPTDPKLADEALRYAEASVISDGRFAITHLAPGKYWVLARQIKAEEAVEKETLSVAWDATARAALRRTAEAAHQEIDLLPCQKVVDFKVSSVKPADTK